MRWTVLFLIADTLIVDKIDRISTIRIKSEYNFSMCQTFQIILKTWCWNLIVIWRRMSGKTRFDGILFYFHKIPFVSFMHRLFYYCHSTPVRLKIFRFGRLPAVIRYPISDICGVLLKRKQPTGMRYGVESQHHAAGLQYLPHTVSAWLHRFEEWQWKPWNLPKCTVWAMILWW